MAGLINYDQTDLVYIIDRLAFVAVVELKSHCEMTCEEALDTILGRTNAQDYEVHRNRYLTSDRGEVGYYGVLNELRRYFKEKA